MVNRRKDIFYRRQVAVIPQLEQIATHGLSLVDLTVTYDGLQAAMDGLLGIENQPRAGDEVGAYLEEVRGRLYLCMEPLIEAARAIKPKDGHESRLRCNLLIRHAIQDDYKPRDIANITREWVA